MQYASLARVYLQEFWSKGALRQQREWILICNVYSEVRVQYASLARVCLQEFGVRARCASRQIVFFHLQCVFW